MSTIANAWEIGIRIGAAYLHGESLTLEYDAGTVYVSGEDLLEAWAARTGTPFTIVEG